MAGAGMLWLVASLHAKGRRSPLRGTWVSAAMLFGYAVAFSFAYLSLATGTGALILFGSVQVTMILAALLAGERPRALEWVGLAVAVGGLVYLVSPGLSAPSPAGCLLMALSGVAWGRYSMRGRGASDPLAETTGNFVRAVPFGVAVSLLALDQLHTSPRGIALAAVSGALTSGLGYVVWYAALRTLSGTRAAIVQLAVPVLAALGGVAFLGESLSPRLALSALLILGGIGLAVSVRSRNVAIPEPDATS